jgi:hypothetical protein
MPAKSSLDRLSQYAIPLLTVGGYALTSLKLPAWGLLVGLLAQPFWLYSSHRAYRQAGQSGLLVSSILMTIVLLYGVANYWLG